MGLLQVFSVASLALFTATAALAGKPTDYIKPYKRAALQNIVTWDEHSIFVRGERIMFFSGEFHPFRLPVPDLYLDVFQKIKAAGYNGVSFYTMWALHEGEPGVFRADGIFDLKPFFKAASDAGIYLLARPGPYINAEVTGGGFPAWLSRVPGYPRTNETSYINATRNYASHMNAIIAEAQITNGGPVILFQPENEYSVHDPPVKFPDTLYMSEVEKQARDAGIVLPFISNDASPNGYFAPGSGQGAVDIYGYDGYPLGFDCANPYTWPDNSIPRNYRMLHLKQSPTTPNSIVEFQGGSFDPWGGLGFDQCSVLLNEQFERVFYKNNYGFGTTIFNIYMTFGGTNWGGISHPGGYTSYDYGAIIKEDRSITREKYSEAKLQANFLAVSPAYLTATSLDNTNANGSYSDRADLAITQLQDTKTRFFVVRHSKYNSLDTTNYKLIVPTSAGNLTIPRAGGELTLAGRDSKIHVVDYAVGDYNLLYSSAEIFSWKVDNGMTSLVVYGAAGEQHELAFTNVPKPTVVEGKPGDLSISTVNGTQTVNFVVYDYSGRRTLKFGKNLTVYIVQRNDAYNYWTLPTTRNKFYAGAKAGASSLLARAGYLLRTASIDDNGCTLSLTGDLNATSPLEILSGAPSTINKLVFNGKPVQYTRNPQGLITANLTYTKPAVSIPDLSSLKWQSIDSLPEIQPGYDDTPWKSANLAKTYNDEYKQKTPTSLFSADYGFNTGNLLYRGHFTATGIEKSIFLRTMGGYAFGSSAWLDNTFIGSCPGVDKFDDCNATYPITVEKGKSYVLTVLQDNMGYDEQYNPGRTQLKNPRGIIDYYLDGRAQDAITWKLTGNLGGEKYIDKTRGPLNEGGLWAERQGYHLPNPPVKSKGWTPSSPLDGFTSAGVKFYAAELDLNLPSGYDIPLAFTFGNTTFSTEMKDYRAQLYVNGYQFGKYVHNVGPQDSFPVPEGILNYQGKNWIGLSLWALDKAGAKLESFALVANEIIQTGLTKVTLSPAPAYQVRQGAY